MMPMGPPTRRRRRPSHERREAEKEMEPTQAEDDKMSRSMVLMVGLLAALSVSVASASESGLSAIFSDYETARLALLEDSLDGVHEPARTIRRELEALRADFSAERAGVPADKAEEVEALLPEAEAAARQLEEATELAPARDAFYALTKPLVRWRQAAGNGPAIAYCPMEKRSWLQDEEEEIGNPYYGQQMPSCGEIVTR